MESISEFFDVAMPWITMGLLLAIFFAKTVHGKKKEKKNEGHGSEGMALGMCFGVALSTALHINVGLDLMAGMALGLLVGSGIEKRVTPKSEKEENRR